MVVLELIVNSLEQIKKRIAIDEQDLDGVMMANVDHRGRITIGQEYAEYWEDKDRVPVAFINGEIVIVKN